MKCITFGLQNLLQRIVPQVDLAPLTGKPIGKLRLSPEQLLRAIQAEALAEWALFMTHRLGPPALPRGPASRPQVYNDRSILLMALVQIVWRKSYEQIVDYVATHPAQHWPWRWASRKAPFAKAATGSGGLRWGCCRSCSSSWDWSAS
jgi:hypothetical protein